MAEKNYVNIIVDPSKKAGERAQLADDMLLPDSTTRSIPARPAGGGPSKVSSKTTQPDDENNTNEWAEWGPGDCLPTTIKCKIKKVPLAGATIQRKIQMAFGQGIYYHTPGDPSDRLKIPKIEAFLQRNRIAKMQMAILADYEYYANSFCEFIFDAAGKKVLEIYHKHAEYSRISTIDKKTRIKKNYYYDSRFTGNDATKQTWIQMPLYQPDDHDAFIDRIKSSKKKFGFHIFFPMPGTLYYAEPWAMSLYQKDSWLDVSANVAKIVKRMQDNQVTLKYLIKIPESFFSTRYGMSKWTIMKDEDKKKIIDAKIAELDELLSGVDNVYKSISQVVRIDPTNGQPIDGIIIEAIDDKTKQGAWIPDSQAADAQIVQGLGMHPSQMGLQPQGGKMGAGSGSDQRESFNTISHLNAMHDCITLEPLQLVARINGWDVQFAYHRLTHTTTNDKENGIKDETQPGANSPAPNA